MDSYDPHEALFDNPKSITRTRLFILPDGQSFNLELGFSSLEIRNPRGPNTEVRLYFGKKDHYLCSSFSTYKAARAMARDVSSELISSYSDEKTYFLHRFADGQCLDLRLGVYSVEVRTLRLREDRRYEVYLYFNNESRYLRFPCNSLEDARHKAKHTSEELDMIYKRLKK